MAKVKGIVAETDKKSCILITPEGEFLKMNHHGKVLRIGEEIELPKASRKWVKTVAAVAAVFLLSLIIPLYGVLNAYAQPVAYVSLDINPSLELGVNQYGTVVDIRAFNQDGVKLLDSTRTQKIGVYQALQNLINQAVKLGYVASNRPNLIVVVFTKGGKFSFSSHQLDALIKDRVTAAHVQAQYLILSTSMSMHAQAASQKASLGKFIIFQTAQKQGIDIHLTELQNDGIYSALKAHGLQITDLEPQTRKIVPDTTENGHADNQEQQSRHDLGQQHDQGSGNLEPSPSGSNGEQKSENHGPEAMPGQQNGDKGRNSSESTDGNSTDGGADKTQITPTMPKPTQVQPQITPPQQSIHETEPETSASTVRPTEGSDSSGDNNNMHQSENDNRDR